MRNNKLQVMSLTLVIFTCGLALGASIENKGENRKGVKSKTHEAMIEVYGVPRSSLDLNFGDDAVIEREVIDPSVKTSRRRNAAVQTKNSPAKHREPSIQAYGLPKRMSELENNGHIERLNLDRVSGLDGKVDKVNVHRDRGGIQAYGMPKRNYEDNGFIERINDPQDFNAEKESSGKNHAAPPPPFPKTESKFRSVRSVDDQSNQQNHLVDLEAQEAKVFRPLFVYRQQVADRYRINQKKNPIYGAYQYGKKKQRNSVYGNSKYYY